MSTSNLLKDQDLVRLASELNTNFGCTVDETCRADDEAELCSLLYQIKYTEASCLATGQSLISSCENYDLQQPSFSNNPFKKKKQKAAWTQQTAQAANAASNLFQLAHGLRHVNDHALMHGIANVDSVLTAVETPGHLNYYSTHLQTGGPNSFGNDLMDTQLSELGLADLGTQASSSRRTGTIAKWCEDMRSRMPNTTAALEAGGKSLEDVFRAQRTMQVNAYKAATSAAKSEEEIFKKFDGLLDQDKARQVAEVRSAQTASQAQSGGPTDLLS